MKIIIEVNHTLVYKPERFSEANDLIDRYIHFYNYKHIRNKTGAAPLTLRNSALNSMFLTQVLFCSVCTIRGAVHTGGCFFPYSVSYGNISMSIFWMRSSLSQRSPEEMQNKTIQSKALLGSSFAKPQEVSIRFKRV